MIVHQHLYTSQANPQIQDAIQVYEYWREKNFHAQKGKEITCEINLGRTLVGRRAPPAGPRWGPCGRIAILHTRSTSLSPMDAWGTVVSGTTIASATGVADARKRRSAMGWFERRWVEPRRREYLARVAREQGVSPQHPSLVGLKHLLVRHQEIDDWKKQNSSNRREEFLARRRRELERKLQVEEERIQAVLDLASQILDLGEEFCLRSPKKWKRGPESFLALHWYIQGIPYGEIMGQCGVNRSNAYQMVRRARKALLESSDTPEALKALLREGGLGAAMKGHAKWQH